MRIVASVALVDPAAEAADKNPKTSKEEQLLHEHVAQVIAPRVIKQGQTVGVPDTVFKFALGTGRVLVLDDPLPDAAAVPHLFARARPNKLVVKVDLVFSNLRVSRLV